MTLPDAYLAVRHLKDSSLSDRERGEAIQQVFLAPYISIQSVSRSEMAEAVRFLLGLPPLPGGAMKETEARRIVRAILEPGTPLPRKFQAVQRTVLAGDVSWATKPELLRVIRFAWNQRYGILGVAP